MVNPSEFQNKLLVISKEFQMVLRNLSGTRIYEVQAIFRRVIGKSLDYLRFVSDSLQVASDETS